MEAPLMMRTWLVGAVVLMSGALGCGKGGGGGGSGATTTYVYASGDQVTEPPAFCGIVRGPEDVGDGSMHYEVDDIGTLGAADTLEAVIISDSFFSSEGCTFTADQTLFEGSVIVSNSGTITGVYADSYDFVVACGNYATNCVFNLTWTATY
jgi:hypothetical protein